MDPSTNLIFFLAGIIIGLLVALVGGVVEYRASLRAKGTVESNRLPGCLLYAVAGLALGGIVSGAASFFLTGGIKPALVLGAGLLSGFYAGFIILFVLWLVLKR